jgi:hypothetical protein
MGTITAQTIVNNAALQLTDVSGVRWTSAELLGWLNDGLRQIVTIQPNATSKISNVQLVAGTRQSIPSDGWMLLRVHRNMGSNGSTPGRAIRVISREVMDSFNPYWHTDTATTEVKNFIYDIEDQMAFYVYPPQIGGQYIELNYSQQPTNLTLSQVIPIFDVFASALLDYIMYRACSKDAEYAPGLQLAQLYLSTFTAAIAVKDKSEKEVAPDNALGVRNPAVRGSDS